ncbi:hypothetical protein ACNOYE_01430 [Nannocystaceae bacterium ST9]
MLALATGLLASTGCARRLKLSPAEFERIDTREQAVDALRVYVSKKLVVIYEEDVDDEEYEVNKNVTESSEERRLKRIISKRTPGLVVDKEDRNGAPLLWVTFTNDCKDKTCAYGFAQTEDGLFRLIAVGPRDGYKEPKSFFVNEKKPLKLGKLKSLAEKNDVLLWKNKRDKLFTIDVVIKKRNVNKRDTDVIRDEGIK